MNKIALGMIVFTIGVVFLDGHYNEAAILQFSKHNGVYSVCNAARQQHDAASELRCGELQDMTNTEFLCEANNNLPSTRCWVEIRG